MDVDLEHVPAQIGTAILDLDGKSIKTTGELSGNIESLNTLYKIFAETPKCLGGEAPRKIAVSFNDHDFIMTASDKFIYIVKTRSVESPHRSVVA